MRGTSGILLVDPGITSDEMAVLAQDIRQVGQPVVAGFSTHPHWDHLLWHAEFGEAPRYSSARGAAKISDFLSNPDWKSRVDPMLPPAIAGQIPLDTLFGQITGLPAATPQFPWEGPKLRIIEHQGHAAGSAALLLEEQRILVAGDMLSDSLIPLLGLDAADPVKDYLAALQLLEDAAESVQTFIPGHGSIGDANQLRARIKLDRIYVQALRNGGGSDDSRLTAGPHKAWLPEVHQRQLKQFRHSLAGRPIR